MNTTNDFGTDDQLASAVAEYLEARDSGCTISRSEWLSRHREQAAELEEFLDESDGLSAGLRAFRGEAPEPDLATDERFIGDYELLEKVGGNMGVIYRARQLSLEREVAVKVLLRFGAGSSVRFLAEAMAMARFHHPHVVRVIEVSRGSVLPFFSMEWCPGGTLASCVEEYQRQPGRAATLLATVARAVHHAHRRGLLHRDLKPANVLIDDKREPVLADFGLAVPLDGSDGADRSRAGTPVYMAPEQLDGEITVATDVFGLGAILYELLTGAPPAAGPTAAAILERVRAAKPVSTRTLNPNVDPDLDAICMKCLAKEPGDRYSTAEDVAADLDRFRIGVPPLARPCGPLGRVRRILREARGATDFKALGPALVGQAGFVLASNSAVFGLIRFGAAEMWLWAAVLISYVPLFVILARDRWSDRGRYNPARNHMWAVWAGHAAACVSVLIGSRLAAGNDFARGIEISYIGYAGVNALAFVIMGSLFAGPQYLLGLAWAIAAIAMGLFLPFAPLIYGVLMAACGILTGIHLAAIGSSRDSQDLFQAE